MTGPVVTVRAGKVVGKTSVDYYGGSFLSFCGIPYARAPVGELRFKAPQPAEPWKGVRDATKESCECPSLDMYFGYYVGNEDNCLTLNIHTKELPTETFKKKPVMVWIHGGGFIYGSNKSECFGPDYLMTEDIVLVSINYRLGAFGFLCLEDPSLGVPGNAGMKDQVMALKWVKENIECFGGDSQNVTIFGESAGGASVHYLTLSPLTKGLFQKAIIQSGVSINIWARGLRNAAEIAKYIGYKVTDEKSILQKLQKESARNIVNAQFKIPDEFRASAMRFFGPVVEYPSEDAFLTEDPEQIIKSGRIHQIPIIIGYNSLEGIFFELIRRTKNVKLPFNLEIELPYDLKLPKGSALSKEVVDKIKKYYYNGENVTEHNLNSTYLMIGDTQFMYGIQKAVQMQKESGNQPIYVYRNALDGPLNYFKKFCQVRFFKTMILCNFLSKMSGNASSLKNIFQSMASSLPLKDQDGVAHADDLFYLFSTFFSPKISPGSKEDICIQKFVRIWTNFAKFGKPTPEPDEKLDKVIWNPIENAAIDSILEIGDELKLIKNVDADRVKFWDEIYGQYRP